MIRKEKVCLLTGVFMVPVLFANSATKGKNVNVVFILADDLGYGDLSCFGQQKFSTPNIDRMAANGMLFTDHYSGSTVSAPSRSSLMTGMHTGHTFIRGNKTVKAHNGDYPVPSDWVLMPEIFKAKGYVTGAFGKWGLGYSGSEGDPNNQGFDEFFGFKSQVRAHRHYPEYVWHNQEKYILEGNDTKKQVTFAPDVIHQKSLEFIRANKDKPFFVYLPTTLPHAELAVPDDEILQSNRGKYPEKPFVAKGPANYGDEKFSAGGYCSQSEPHAVFASMVMRVDKYVGEVLDLLVELGIDKNTLVIFTSDNGPHREGGADPVFFDSNGKLTGIKRDMTDGGIRLPMIAQWNGTIKKGATSSLVSAFWDFVPTFAELIGADKPENTDGISMLPTLLGEDNKQQKHEALYWEFSYKGYSQAVRMGDWKGIKKGADFMLYNLKDDISEQNNIADKHPDIVEKIKQIMLREHTPSKLFPTPSEKKE